LRIAEARRLAIAATGLGSARPSSARIGLAHLRKVVGQVGVVQLDSVNAVARAHELLFFSRLGPYDKHLLHDLVYRRRELYEGWLHVASLIPTELWPALAWRREGANVHDGWHGNRRANAKLWDEVLDHLRERGPLAAADLDHLGPKGGTWWGWSRAKNILEGLFTFGEVAATTRRGAFERVYDLTERVMPPAILAAAPVPEAEARRMLVLSAVRSLGVGTMDDIADYYRQKKTPVKKVLAELVADGELVPVDVEGWAAPAYTLPTVRLPRRGCPDGRLVSPFDPLVWYRPRNVRLFDFTYAIEIYVPEPKRVYGYYVLPFLQGDSIVARLDVRSDRKAGVLRVPGAFAEKGADVDVDLLLRELRLLASWQGCGDIVVGTKGDLAKPLRKVAS
jgi:uncharacterized protein YcaQ